MDTSERKRARSRSSSPSLSPQPHSPTPLDYHVRPTKFHRAPTPTDNSFLCTLPPTCSQPDTARSFATEDELEAHQTRMHRWMCRVPIRDKPGRIGEGATVLVPEQFTGRGPRAGQRFRECGKVFPDERLLDLHYTETHDPIAREKLERGDKIFECFLPPDQCTKVCLTPKKRRRHMIDKHGYPNEYYFAITNHGLNRITREEGPAASLLRPYRPRPPEQMEREGGRGTAHGHGHGHPHGHGGHGPAHTLLHPHPHTHAPAHRPNPASHHAPPHPPSDVDMDDLTSKMGALESSLAFVPRNVRRAAKRETRAVMEVG